MIRIDRQRTAADVLPAITRMFERSAGKIRSIETAWRPEHGAPVFTAGGVYVSRGWTEWTQGFQFGAAVLHIAVGSTILLLAIVRLFIRRTRGVPAAHPDNPALVNWLGQATHFLLYGFLFLMPVTGLVAWFGGVELSAELHELGRLVLIPAIGLHALGGLAEHFVFRNDSLRRMLTFK